MSTPLLCRDSADERARDLLQKRDHLLLLREGPQGAASSAQVAAATLGAELGREERRCHEALEQVRERAGLRQACRRATRAHIP